MTRQLVPAGGRSALRAVAAALPTARQLHHDPPTIRALRWRRRVHQAAVCASFGAIAVIGPLVLTSSQEASAATLVSTAAVPAGLGAHDSPSPSSPGGMPGMDMPGMDDGYGKTASSAQDRPLAPVLGVFGGGTSAVLVAAGLLRRRDRVARAAREAARAAVMSRT
ncbi:MAG TPA: hypothetical protein VFF32_06510 [Dermatophilaceae bacterium]|nr:hypothetical protein [Dermatophilaceae bacterium]